MHYRKLLTLTFALGATLFAGCAGGPGAAPHSNLLPQSAAVSLPLGAVTPAPSKLYVADYHSDIGYYSLPLYAGEPLTMYAPQINNPTTLGIAGKTMFAGYYYSGLLCTLSLPLTANSVPDMCLSGLGVQAIANTATQLYITDEVTRSIKHYTLPLSANSTPDVSIPIEYPNGIALTKTMLYVSDTWQNTVSAFALPLVANEKPSIVVTGFHGPTGLAATSTHLYVADQQAQAIDVYPLPLTGKYEKIVSTVGTGTYPDFLTIGGTTLYVSDGSSQILSYPLPLAPGAVPAVTLTNGGSPQAILAK